MRNNSRIEQVEKKISFLMEKICLVQKNILWEVAYSEKLTPTQIEIIIYIAKNKPEKNTVSYIARDMGLTKPTISESVKALKRKRILKTVKMEDRRSYGLILSEKGKKIHKKIHNFNKFILEYFKKIPRKEKNLVFDSLFNFIDFLRRKNILQSLRVCPYCAHYKYDKKRKIFVCDFSKKKITKENMFFDCPSFEEK